MFKFWNWWFSFEINTEEEEERNTRVSPSALSRAFFLCAHYFQATYLRKSSTIDIVITFHFNWILYFLSFFFLQIPTVPTDLCADSSGRKDPYVLVYRLSWFFS